MGRKLLFVLLIWVIAACAMAFLYFERETSPVKEFISWAISVWVILAAIVAVAFALSTWVIKHDFGRPKEKSKETQIKTDIATRIIVVSILEEFGYEFETTADSLRLRFSPGIYVNPAVRVEDVQLEIKGKRYDTDWVPMDEAISGYIDKGCYVRAILPKSFKPGKYRPRIVACIENREYFSESFDVEYQKPTLGKEN